MDGIIEETNILLILYFWQVFPISIIFVGNSTNSDSFLHQRISLIPTWHYYNCIHPMSVSLNGLAVWLTLRNKCPYSELFWSAFSRIRIYGFLMFPGDRERVYNRNEWVNFGTYISHFHSSRYAVSKQNDHCVKCVQIRSFFWSILSCIQSKYKKIRTRKKLRIWALFTQWIYSLLSIIASEYKYLTFFISGRSVLDLVGLAGFERGIFGKGSNKSELLRKILLL